MEINEIPQQNRALGPCAGCSPNRHFCSWVIDGRDYCDECKKKRCGEVEEPKEEIALKPGSMRFHNVGSMVDNPNNPSFPFQLNPAKTHNFSVGQLDTGWVLSVGTENHVFTSKTALIKKMTEVISAKKEVVKVVKKKGKKA